METAQLPARHLPPTPATRSRHDEEGWSLQHIAKVARYSLPSDEEDESSDTDDKPMLCGKKHRMMMGINEKEKDVRDWNNFTPGREIDDDKSTIHLPTSNLNCSYNSRKWSTEKLKREAKARWDSLRSDEEDESESSDEEDESVASDEQLRLLMEKNREAKDDLHIDFFLMREIERWTQEWKMHLKRLGSLIEESSDDAEIQKERNDLRECSAKIQGMQANYKEIRVFHDEPLPGPTAEEFAAASAVK